MNYSFNSKVFKEKGQIYYTTTKNMKTKVIDIYDFKRKLERKQNKIKLFNTFEILHDNDIRVFFKIYNVENENIINLTSKLLSEFIKYELKNLTLSSDFIKSFITYNEKEYIVIFNLKIKKYKIKNFVDELNVNYLDKSVYQKDYLMESIYQQSNFKPYKSFKYEIEQNEIKNYSEILNENNFVSQTIIQNINDCIDFDKYISENKFEIIDVYYNYEKDIDDYRHI